MKTEIHPEYVEAHVRCTCGNEFTTRSTQAEIHVEICSNCHPFYTGKQKLVDTGGRVERFRRRAAKRQSGVGELNARAIPWRRPRVRPSRPRPALDDEPGQWVATRDAPVGGQAVLEGVMMRGVRTLGGRRPQAGARPARRGGRAHGRRRSAARRDRGRSVPDRVGPQAPPAAAAADRARRRRARRVADDRLQGARDLRQRADARGGGADLRRPVGRARSSFALALSRRAVLPRPGHADEPDQGPARLRGRCSGSSRGSCGR